ncbi:mannose-specific lectin-like [Cynoglossus semilaevis]|uniref:Mannose-specific lectin-like n=1 Tax=Cynoglossus semilaevis TaxID=244447 RepID=A0A3P8UEU4_CYNSE|nr:mannose-specific lectin-like [Cynoglossus semilaevis]XP_024914975.1 mannose-specific lectin-like [Cynoglossus semilaevis]
MNRNSLSTDQELRAGDYLMSNNGIYKAVLQTDGNFVVYGWAPLWASNTWNKDSYRLLLQQDNNLVIYDKENQPLWASNTHSSRDSQRMLLTMQEDGRLVLYNDGKEIWSVGK